MRARRTRRLPIGLARTHPCAMKGGRAQFFPSRAMTFPALPKHWILVAALLTAGRDAVSQQAAPAGHPSRPVIHIDVTVTPKPGRHDTWQKPVTGLTRQDFTLRDNRAVQPLQSFQAADDVQVPVEVILMVDAINIPISTMAYEESEVRRFLAANGGHLDHPTNVGFLTNAGYEIPKSFYVDGGALSRSIGPNAFGLRDINRTAGFWGQYERSADSLKAVNQLLAYAQTLPGRKAVVWLSPGWPLLTGVRNELDTQSTIQVFDDAIYYSTKLREAKLVFYQVNPLGPNQSLVSVDYYKEFVKGIRNPSEAYLSDLSLQVLSAQSGGLVLQSASNLAGMIEECFQDMDSWYELGFTEAKADKPNEYHHLDVRVNRPGLTVRTREGYYAQP